MELLALLGLLVGVGYLASSDKKEEVYHPPGIPDNPFKSGDPCKLAFDSLPGNAKAAVAKAVAENNKANLIVAANSVRLINPTLATCLDDLAGVKATGGDSKPPFVATDCTALLEASDPISKMVISALITASKGSKVGLQLAADRARELKEDKLADCLQGLADKTEAIKGIY